MTARRRLCLFFPSLVIDRCQREDPALRFCAFAVTREEKGHLHISAANALASRAGVRLGMRLTDARALLPTLKTLPDDATANARVKQRLIEWCNRYSPLVAEDGFGGIVLDITGCAHLFGGEAALLADVQSRIRRTGYCVRGSIADTLGAAWALARYGKRTIVSGEALFNALDPLPVDALRLPEEAIRKLRRVGLTTIAALRKIPRQSLAARYGPVILLRLDQALHQAEEPTTPHHSLKPYRARRTLAEPIGTVSAVEYVLPELLKEICLRLEEEHAGARRLHLDCYRVDGSVARCCVGTSKPVRSVTHLMRLFSEKLDTLDAGFGIETLILSVPEIDKLDLGQLSLPRFDQDAEEDAALDRLMDRLGLRLGFQEICRLQVCESWLPECAIKFRSVADPMVPSAIWPQSRVRPVRLIHPPIDIGVSTIHPGGLPVQFRIGRQLRRIVRAEGPERLTAEWWHDEAPSWEIRDYYRIEDDGGNRLWIFCEMKPLPPSSYATRWFLHGHLP